MNSTKTNCLCVGLYRSLLLFLLFLLPCAKTQLSCQELPRSRSPRLLFFLTFRFSPSLLGPALKCLRVINLLAAAAAATTILLIHASLTISWTLNFAGWSVYRDRERTWQSVRARQPVAATIPIQTRNVSTVIPPDSPTSSAKFSTIPTIWFVSTCVPNVALQTHSVTIDHINNPKLNFTKLNLVINR